MADFELAIIGAVWLVSAITSYAIARRRGSPTTTAFLTGLLFGPVGVVLIAVQKGTDPVRFE